MSNKKTSQQEYLAEKQNNDRKAQIRELAELRSKAIELETRISRLRKGSFKQFNIRNLKIFANACNLVAPFVLSVGITVGAFNLFGGGLPFHSDEIIKYKTYNMDFQTKGCITMNDEYQPIRWYEELPLNSLVVYTPYEEQDGCYVRFKREYDVKKLTSLDLYNAVLAEDYMFIQENFKEYKEEKQVVDKIDDKEELGYFFEASLHMLDKNDILKYNETENMFITIIESVLGLSIGGAITYYRDFDFLYKLRTINGYYSVRISYIKSLKQELKDTNEKILFLTRNKEGKN